MSAQYEIFSDKDAERAFSLDTTIMVYSLDNTAGKQLASGTITDWNEHVFFINGRPFERTSHVFLTTGDVYT